MEGRAPRRRDADQKETPESGGPLTPTVDEVTRVEQSVEFATTRQRVFEVLTNPNNITRYAGGIEGAEVIDKPNDDYVGATVELVTRSGNIRRAKVLRADQDCIEVQDERGLNVRWELEELGPEKVRLRNIIEGPLSPRAVNQLRYDADVKFQALQHILDDTDPKAGAG